MIPPSRTSSRARVAELQTSVDTLTAQRDAIYDEIRELRAAREADRIEP